MKTFVSQRCMTVTIALTVLAASAVLVPSPATAETEVTERPIEEFVLAQGTFDIGFLFVPPVPNFIGWSDPEAELGMSVDYAGLADVTCGGIAGTTFDGEITERTLDDGRVEVSVELETFDAISWVIDGFDFGNGPVIFGTRWEEDADGNCVFNGSPALGDSVLQVDFINPEPGHPMPDLIQLAFFPEEGQELLSLAIHAEAEGLLPDGTSARAETHQVGRVKDGVLTFSVEKVFIEPID